MHFGPMRRQSFTTGLLFAGLLWGPAVHAQNQTPPRAGVSGAAKPAASDAQLAAAKEFFERGRTLYNQGKYDAAWFEFSSAYQMVDLPDLLFNMARSEAKLNRTADAIKHYREFLAKAPNDPDAEKVRATIAQLEHPEGLPPAPAAAPPVVDGGRRRFPIYSAIAGGGTLLFTIIGAAALGSATAQYNHLASTCAPNCVMAEALSPKPTYQAGQAFLTLAAIGAAGTAGLLVWELRHGRSERKPGALVSTSPSFSYGSP